MKAVSVSLIYVYIKAVVFSAAVSECSCSVSSLFVSECGTLAVHLR